KRIMWLNSWFRGLTSQSKLPRAGSTHRAVVRKAREAGFRPRLEVLEDRTVPSTFNVTTTLDGVAGSLRQAVVAANTNPGADTINVPVGTYTLTQSGTAGDLEITGHVTIQGAGAGTTVIDADYLN